MKNFKFILSLFVLFALLTGCSYFKNKFTQSSEESTKIQQEYTKEKTLDKTSASDLAFYNKYIEISNKISESIDEINKSYMTSVPAPQTISKSSLIITAGLGLYINNLERTIKEYRRSYYEGGELSKLGTDNEDMKLEVENVFKELLKVMEKYYSVSNRVSKYYGDGEYKNDLSKAAAYDTEMKDGYKEYETVYNKFKEALKKFKPQREKKNPDDYTNKDEKAVVIVQNALENTVDQAETIYNLLEGTTRNSEVGNLEAENEKFRRRFEEETKKIQSTEFSDKTKYIKYSFEDYFTKMTEKFMDETDKFIKEMKKGKMSERDFGLSYDNVVRNYNYMINAYNTSINSINTFKVY